MEKLVQVVQKTGSVAIDKLVTQQLKLGWTLYGSPFELQGNAAQLLVGGAGSEPSDDAGEYRVIQKSTGSSLEQQITVLALAGWKMYGSPFEVYGLPAQAMVNGDVAITPGAGGGGSGPITASDITDATTIGISLIQAANAAAGRLAIGAGTSSLTIGTTATTAKAGNYAPTAAEVGNALKQKTAIAALSKISDPSAATTEQVATLLNSVVDALKA